MKEKKQICIKKKKKKKNDGLRDVAKSEQRNRNSRISHEIAESPDVNCAAKCNYKRTCEFARVVTTPSRAIRRFAARRKVRDDMHSRVTARPRDRFYSGWPQSTFVTPCTVYRAVHTNDGAAFSHKIPEYWD